MDDLKLLRALGRELQHEPPATLARQRDRLSRPRARRWWANWWAAGLVAVATAAAVVVPTVVLVDRHVAAPLTGTRAVDLSGAQNVLVIGSDTRKGPGNAEYGSAEARGGGDGRSDTIMIVHVPADRNRITAVSIPRDSMVKIPRCAPSPARTYMINSVYATGGADCLKATLERLTGLTIQHTVEIEFSGFKGMVDALGGVEVTLPRPVDDRLSKLKLPAGKSLLNGESALGYVRLRRYGDGSDIQRIERQQQLVSAMLKKAGQVMTEPDRLKRFLEEMRKSVRTDLSVESMYRLAGELSETELTAVTVPWKPHPTLSGRLVWKQPEADALFRSLR